jgi:hypothetical protein
MVARTQPEGSSTDHAQSADDRKRTGICRVLALEPYLKSPTRGVTSQPHSILQNGNLTLTIHKLLLNITARRTQPGLLAWGFLVAGCSLTLTLGSSLEQQALTVEAAIIAGWTGRDPAAVEKHIDELKALGVRAPASTPIFYRVAASRLTTQTEIQASGTDSGGEVEFLLLHQRGKLWVGVGSDHTDRKVETYSVTVSKQMCDKPIAPRFWPYDELADHWDDLLLRSFVLESGERTVYQEGSVSAMLHPEALISLYTGGGALDDSALMFCGTLPVNGSVRPNADFAFEMEDPVLGRKITHGYRVVILPVLG